MNKPQEIEIQSCIKPFNISGKSYVVEQVKEYSSLQKLLDQGLSSLYENVFGEPPYNEVFEDGEVEDILFDYLKSNGHMFILKHFESEKPLAFMIGTPIGSKFDSIEGMGDYIVDRRTAYLADDGVDNSLRRRGVSTLLKGIFLNACKQDGYEQVVLRTRADNYAQISAVNKAQGVILKDVDQYVTRCTTGNESCQELNKFFLFNFQNSAQAKTDILEKALVMRKDGQDTIVIGQTLPQGLSTQDVLNAYPSANAVHETLSNNIEGETIFNGHMYISHSLV